MIIDYDFKPIAHHYCKFTLVHHIPNFRMKIMGKLWKAENNKQMVCSIPFHAVSKELGIG
jgi:hypothetical protein